MQGVRPHRRRCRTPRAALMTAYELDDGLVRNAVEHIKNGFTADSPAGVLGSMLESQIPLPAPTGIGAVVRVVPPVYGNAVFIRTGGPAGRPEYQWTAHNDCDSNISTERLEAGRVVAVLSEGVEF